MELFDKTKFSTQKELFDFLVKNKQELISQKKAITKEADGIGLSSVRSVGAVKSVSKAEGNDNKKELDALLVINTTNVFDSHSDVHIPGLWDKSLSENRNIMHLQEHEMAFDKVISSKQDLNAYVNNYTFKELGFDYEGSTQALVFDSKIKKSRNPYMFEQYKDGYVDNHSVGMRYVKIILAVNDEDYGAEYEAWGKYFPQILVNAEQAEKQGYFWAVKEAKVIEGSAVPIGSNTITPTLEVKSEPPLGTQNTEPTEVTLNEFKNILKQNL